MEPGNPATITTVPNGFVLDSVSTSSEVNVKADAYALIAREISTLEDLIQIHERDIRRWKTQHNSLSDISRLPTEILLHIFDLLLPVRDDIDYSPPHEALSVSHVCTSWRRTVLESPSLWKRRPLLRRQDPRTAKGSRHTGPMVVEINKNDRPYHGPAQFFEWSDVGRDVTAYGFEHALSYLWDTITVLSFKNVERYYSLLCDEVIWTCQQPALSLETLLIQFIAPPYPEGIPDALIGKAPRLRHVHVQNWNPLRNPSILSAVSTVTLTTLEIKLSRKPHSAKDLHRDSIPGILRSLRLFPNLERLRLSKVLKPVEDDDTSWSLSTPSMHLPALRRLDIKDELSIIASFLKHISYPPETVVSAMGLKRDEFTPSDSTNTAEVLVQASELAYSAINGLRMVQEDRYTFAAELMTTPLPLGRARDTATIRAHAKSPPPDIAQTIFRILPLDSLQELSIFSIPPRYELEGESYIAIDWKRVGQLPSLRFITTNPIYPSFVSTLALSESDKSAPEPYFPSLEEIHAYGTKFWSQTSHPNGPPPEWQRDQCINVEELSACISMRSNCGYGPYALGLDKKTTEISDANLTSLKAVFRDVYYIDDDEGEEDGDGTA